MANISPEEQARRREEVITLLSGKFPEIDTLATALPEDAPPEVLHALQVAFLRRMNETKDMLTESQGEYADTLNFVTSLLDRSLLQDRILTTVAKIISQEQDQQQRERFRYGDYDRVPLKAAERAVLAQPAWNKTTWEVMKAYWLEHAFNSTSGATSIFRPYTDNEATSLLMKAGRGDGNSLETQGVQVLLDAVPFEDEDVIYFVGNYVNWAFMNQSRLLLEEVPDRNSHMVTLDQLLRRALETEHPGETNFYGNGCVRFDKEQGNPLSAFPSTGMSGRSLVSQNGQLFPLVWTDNSGGIFMSEAAWNLARNSLNQNVIILPTSADFKLQFARDAENYKTAGQEHS